MISKDSRIFVTGHRGMVGSAFVRILTERGYECLITRSHSELDLCDTRAVDAFFQAEKPDIVLLIAAKVGGIQANINEPVEFLYANLMIQNNVIKAAADNGAKKVVFFGSSCIYPRDCPQPMKEEYLLTGPLEPTNEGYALAKIAGLRLVQYFERQYGLSGLCIMPSNIYGRGDSFDPVHSHVLSALVRKFVEAKEQGQERVVNWGTGSARREFLNVDDLVHAVLLLDERWKTSEIINVGPGTDISIKELSEMVAHRVGFEGGIEWDSTKPDGMPRKCMDTSKLKALGFSPEISLGEGIEQMIQEYQLHKQRTVR